MTRNQWYIGAPNGIVLCVQAANDGEVRGLFYHGYSEKPVPFMGIGQMTLRMEMLFDWLQYPHPSTITRSFTEQAPTRAKSQERNRIMSDNELLSKHGDIGTFIVRVQHRQNSSWQGRITWMEEDKTMQFRSVWEMIKLIESAVDTVCPPEDLADADWEGDKEGGSDADH